MDNRIAIKMSKNSLKIFIYCSLLFAFCSLLNGCVTVPVKEALPTYNINGINYIPLISLCNLRGISWEYDTFAQTFTLSKDAHKINLMLGGTLVVVDGRPRYLKHPVDIYQDIPVVPYKFKEQILDVLFKEPSASGRVTTPLSKIKKIVIDAGHGGSDPGAIGKTGLREKVVTLDIAKRLSRLLSAEGFEVVMTRSTDRFVPLSSRTDIANNSQADLFLSIHLNANRVRSLNGLEVYYVANSVDDSERALWAAQNAALDLQSSCFEHPSLNLKAVLWDMIYTHSRAESIELSRSICQTINQNLDTKILGIKGGRFYVLKGVRMPAVLIEVGFLSNTNEERRLKNSYYRQQITEGIVEGIHNYAQDLVLSVVKR